MSERPLDVFDRPSIEYLKKRAKERLADVRASEPGAKLSDAQQGLARDLGFPSWPALVRSVESARREERLGVLLDVADDMLAAYGGDPAATTRLLAFFGSPGSASAFQRTLRRRLEGDRHEDAGPVTVADTRALLARHQGFPSWEALVARLTAGPARESDGSPTSACFRVDESEDTLVVTAPPTAAEWDRIFTTLEERRLTGFQAVAVTDEVMRRLGRLDFVRSVNLAGARGLRDQGLRRLGGMASLENLDLSGRHSPVTDRGLAVLSHLPRLRRLSLSWVQGVSDTGLAALRHCGRMESLDLMGTPTGDGALAALRGLPRLNALRTGRALTDAGLAHLHTLPRFSDPEGEQAPLELMTFVPPRNALLVDGAITDDGMASLAGLDGLQGLTLFGHTPHVTPAGLRALGALGGLAFLGVPGERCDDRAMEAIVQLSALRMLMAQGTVSGDAGFVALSRSPSLEYLWGRECPNLTGIGFRALAAAPTLRGLGVSLAGVDDTALSALPEFPALEELMPMDLRDADFRHVGACPRLTSLWCMYCRETGDDSTTAIRSLPLTHYYAGNTRITDASLRTLSTMSTLERLEFWSVSGISGEGVARLARLPRLRDLTVSGSPAVPPAVRDAFPRTARVRIAP